MNDKIKIKMSPKDFFLYVGAMITLYVSVFSLVALLFQYIDILFPDRLESYRNPYSSAARFQMASLIVIFPVYLFITRFLNKEIRLHPEKKELGIRRWLIYFTLFVAGATVLIDLIVLLNTFLGGELTTRFLLKVLAVLVVVGDVFIYYFLDLKGRWEEKPHQARIGMWAWSTAIVAALIGGFVIMGSPQDQRLLRFDEQKINNLQNIQWQIVNYWQVKESLPETLLDLEDPLSGFVVPLDPQTDEPYTYRAVGEMSFELCATFNKASGAEAAEYPARPRPVTKFPGIENATWQHDAGETCFERTIDPDRYPVR